MRKYIVFLGIILLAGLASSWAQGPQNQPERRRERLQDLAVWKMMEVLDLSQEQTDRFLPAFREMQKKESALQDRREMLLAQLEKELSDKARSKELTGIIGQLQDLTRQTAENRENFFSQAQEILTVQQQAKLVLFQERFEQHLRDMMRQLREEKWRQGQFQDQERERR